MALSNYDLMFLDSILENIPDMIFVKDAEELRFVLFNRAGEELLGFKREDLIGKNDYDFFPKEEADFFVAKDREVLASKKLIEIAEEPIQTAHGQRYLHTKKIPILDEMGKPCFLLGISEDITEKKLQDEEIARAKLAAERASEAKSQFLANMSHELRTPLNAIVGFSKLLMGEVTESGDTKYFADLETINTSGLHLLSIINEMLDLTSIEAGKLTLNYSDCCVGDICDDLRDHMRLLSARSSADFTVRCDVLDLVFRCDPVRVRQVIINLVSNAFKFAPSGHVNLRIDTVEKEERSYIQVVVSDNGIGIAPENQEKIFEEFTQVHDGNEVGPFGSGLGLAITRKILNHLGGTIAVESEVQVGTTFTVLIPTDKVDVEAA